MAETVFAMVQRQEKERREAIARGEPDPFLIKEPEEPAREPNRLERFEAWMATDWEFGPYYWEEGQERPESLKERCRQRFWWLYEKNLRGAEFVGVRSPLTSALRNQNTSGSSTRSATRSAARSNGSSRIVNGACSRNGRVLRGRLPSRRRQKAEGDVEHRSTRRRRQATRQALSAP